MYLDFEQITASSSVKDVDDLTIPAEATHAELQSDTQDVRYTMDAAASAVACIGARNAQASALFAGSICNLTITIGSNTWRYPCPEGSGSNVYETRTKTANAIVNASAANWTTLQNVYNHNLASGFRLSGAIRIPAEHGSSTVAADNNTLTNPPGDWLNNPESEIDFECAESDAPTWNGLNIPNDYQHGDALGATDLDNRDVNTVRKDRYRILA